MSFEQLLIVISNKVRNKVLIRFIPFSLGKKIIQRALKLVKKDLNNVLYQFSPTPIPNVNRVH